ncbi:MAG: hypothetical protein LBK95_13265 [Bifidobacteriaceae bacterium]|jgi:hypothetical protein|nr:hypothetical protein [Bifidobacteriaceae bacterium]
MTEPHVVPEPDNYELLQEPDGTSWSVRENLLDILTRELLGPDDGDQELLDVLPDARYLLGRIAPSKLRPSEAVPATEEADDDSTVELGDDVAALESSGVPLSDVDDTALDGDEGGGGDRDDEPVRRGLMIPASMGLRFQIPRGLEAFTVRASWGVYNPEKTGEFAASGREISRYRRTPRHADTRVAVADLKPGVTAEFILHGNVRLRVDSYDDAELDRLLVEAALCNDRETPRRIPTNAWMFQTQGNWARPRDLAHYEQFRHFHETFYSRVEPLSVTPFSVTALERGLESVLVSAARVIQAVQAVGLSPEKDAFRVETERPFLENLIDAVVARTRKASDEASAEYARLRLINRLGVWEARDRELVGRQLTLAYERFADATRYGALIRAAESIRSREGAAGGAPFVVANSMHEVQPEINLLVSPDPERLFYAEPLDAPVWELQPSVGGGE